MLTMPSTATTDTDFIRQAVAHGVRFFRINSAHDSLDEWKQMATLIKKEAKAQKKEVLVAVDLASWKMRTGHAKRIIQPVELAQKKQTVSLVLTSKKGAYTCIASSSQAINHMATVALSKAFLQQCCTGATIKLTDVRGKKRVLHITHIQDDAVICTLTGKTIIDQDTLFVVTNHIQAFQECPRNIRPQPVEIIVQEGDMVYIGTDVPCSTVAEGDKPIALAFTDPVVLE